VSQQVIWHPGAEADVDEAADWYLERSEYASGLFETELNALVKRVTTSPKSFPISTGGMRKARFSSLPFTIHFDETLYGVEIFAVAHAKRREGYWTSRLR